jgi:cell division protein FtsB
VAVVLVVGLGVLWSVVSQGFEELAEAEAECARLEVEKHRLEQRISELEATLEALRTDPGAVESLARRELGWVRPGEEVVLVATPAPPTLPVPQEATPTPVLALPE